MIIFTENDYKGQQLVRIPARKDRVSICIITYYDNVFENNESFTVTANLPSNNIVPTICEATVTITEDSKLVFLSCK